MPRSYSKWTDAELKIIKTNFGHLDCNQLHELIPNHSLVSLQKQISNLKLSKPQFRKCDLTPLLLEQPISCYWLGFLAADGGFTERRIGLTIAESDYNHLRLFLDFVKSKNKVRKVGDTNCLRLWLTQVEVVKELRCRLKIVNNKTKQPLDLTWFLDKPELFFSFIVGYIDGDGCVAYQSGNCHQLSVVGDKSWLANFRIMHNFLYYYFGYVCETQGAYLRRTRVALPQSKKKKKTYTLSNFYIAKTKLLEAIRAKADDLCLPYMKRKLGKI